MTTTTRRGALVTTTAAVTLLASACGPAATDDADPTDDASVTEPSPTTSDGSPDDASPSPAAGEDDPARPSPDDTDSASAAPAVDVPELDARCTVEPDLPQVETIRYAVPSSWQVDGRCDLLDPDLEDLPEATEVDAAVSVDVAPIEFGVATDASGTLTDVTTWVGSRSNLQSVRTVGTSTDAGLRPGGDRVTSWQFDLDAGTDEQGGTMTIVGSTEDEQQAALAGAVADSVAQTVLIEPPAEGPATSPGRTAFAVTRVEGGGTPYAVTHDGDCFRLRPGGPTDDATDEVCDVEPTDELHAAVLGDDVVVGHTDPTAVTVQAPDVDGPYGLTTAVEGSSLFAFRLADVDDTELVATDATGAEVAAGTVG